jgi:hypothetical protein
MEMVSDSKRNPKYRVTEVIHSGNYWKTMNGQAGNDPISL